MEDVEGVDAGGVLECIVDTPLKENDGTKDAYISYLVTTHVGLADMPSHPPKEPSFICRI